jgi:hypothetical protein
MDHTEQSMNLNNLVTEKAIPYYDPKGGAARAAVIAQSPEVKTTKKTLPRFHGKQTNTTLHSHDTPTICSSIRKI